MSIWYGQLVKAILFVTFTFFVSLLLIHGFTEEGNRELIRWSARFSFTLFILAFSASSIYHFSKNSCSFWLRMNRKHIGITFAIIHFVHLFFLLLLQVNFYPVFDMAATGSLIGGGIAYLFVVLMLITSLDTIKRKIAKLHWKILHMVGGYWIWSIYMTSYYKRAGTEPIHWIPVIILVTTLSLRVMKWIQKENKWNVSSLLSIVIIWLLPASCFGQESWEGDILIENGLVVDGSGNNAGFYSDVLIENGRIKRIGNSDGSLIKVARKMEAQGMIVAPGFIDIHAHGDPLKTPEFQNFLSMGVTSIALGMDGSSVLAGKMKNWLHTVDSIRTGVNIIPFVGHGTIRKESGIGVQKEPSDEEISEMIRFLDLAMRDGCWGLSMGLEYIPGIYSSKKELESLAQAVGRNHGIITSHIRNEDDDQIEKSLQEMKSLARYCPVNISHLKVVFGKNEKRANEILELLFDHENEKFPVTADLYPYTASYTGIGIVFPEWAKNPKMYQEIKSSRGEELLVYLKNKVNRRNGPKATLFGSGPYKGKTLHDLESEYELPFEKILKDIIGPYGSSAAFFVMNGDLQERLMIHPKVVIASDGSPTMYHPRGYGTFSRVLEKFVVQDSILTLEQAIHKMTGAPAKTIQLTDRGLIRPGYIADLLIFDPLNVKELSTFEQPHILSKGMEWIIIDGKIAVHNGEIQNKAGRVLRKLPDN